MIKKQRKIGIFISYVGQFIQIMTGLIYTPIMLRILGQSEYGLYQLVYSVVSYLCLFNLGFSASYIRFYAKEKAVDNKVGIARLNGMFMLIFCAMSCLSVICGIIMIAKIHFIFGEGLTNNEYKIARILMSLMIINFALTFPNSVFNCIITSQEKFLFQKTLIMIQYLLNPFLTLPLLILGYGSIGIVSVTTMLTIVVLFINMYYCFNKLHIKFLFSGLEFSKLKEMWIFTFFIFLNQIIDQINWSVDKFLLGRMTGTTAVAVYGIGGQINTLYLQLSTAVSNIFVPKVNKIVAETGDDKELTILFTKVGRIQFIIIVLILSGVIIFGKSFIYFWAGSGYSESYYVTLLLICPVTIPLIQNLGIEIQRAKNKHKARSFVFLIIAFANIFASIPLIKLMGPIGAAVGTTLSLVLGNVVFMNWYYYFKLGINVIYYWKNILRITPGLIIPVLIGGYNMLFVVYKSFWELVCGIFMYTLMYCFSMYFFGLNIEEKNIIKEPIYKIWRRL